MSEYTRTCVSCNTIFNVDSKTRNRKTCGELCANQLRGKALVESRRSLPRRKPILSANEDALLLPLTKGYFATIDFNDSDLANQLWYAAIKKKASGEKIYAYGHRTNAGVVKMHKVILERKIGRALTTDEMPDHIDGNGLNNRRSNLRVATGSQNNANQRLSSRNTSGYKGVSWDKRRGRWTAYIKINGKKKSLGYHNTAEDAHKAYEAEAKHLFGEFANTGSQSA